jgi:1-acyl-sn-glycerol-3-phosphate acyltransferase
LNSARAWRATLPFRRRTVHWATRFLATTAIRVEARGHHHVPKGAAIIAGNHLGHADPLLVLSQLQEPPEIVGLANLLDEIAAPFIHFYSPILVRRDEVDRTVLQETLDALSSGSKVMIFPEARISRSGALEPARDGIGYIAGRANVPIVPVAITGTERLIAAWRNRQRPHLTVTFGPPLHPDSIPPGSNRARRSYLTQETMRRIAALLPPPYRGVYGTEDDGR